MMSFQEIDARRAAHGITRADVYRRAEVDGETWRRLARKLHKPNVSTLERLTKALDELIEERAA